MSVARRREAGKRGRISRSGDFDRVYREGRSHANRFLVLYSFPRPEERDEPQPRLGISVGRKLGSAVDRNAVKRSLREAFWDLQPQLPADHDYVLVARRDLADLVGREGTRGVESALSSLLSESGLVGRNT